MRQKVSRQSSSPNDEPFHTNEKQTKQTQRKEARPSEAEESSNSSNINNTLMSSTTNNDNADDIDDSDVEIEGNSTDRGRHVHVFFIIFPLCQCGCLRNGLQVAQNLAGWLTRL